MVLKLNRKIINKPFIRKRGRRPPTGQAKNQPSRLLFQSPYPQSFLFNDPAHLFQRRGTWFFLFCPLLSRAREGRVRGGRHRHSPPQPLLPFLVGFRCYRNPSPSPLLPPPLPTRSPPPSSSPRKETEKKRTTETMAGLTVSSTVPSPRVLPRRAGTTRRTASSSSPSSPKESSQESSNRRQNRRSLLQLRRVHRRFRPPHASPNLSDHLNVFLVSMCIS